MDKRPIAERRDEYHIAKAMLLGCKFKLDGLGYRYKPWPGVDTTIYLGGWSITFASKAEAARDFLGRMDEDLEGWV